jgi:CheY-like chemotaxis protein
MLGLGVNRQFPTVLLIDDDMVSREVMATVLTMGGYPVHTAEDAAAALALLTAGCQPEVILMDAQMPGLSGTALIGRLRALAHASIFVISASQPPGEVAAAGDGFLQKPFGAAELDRLLEEREAQARPAEPGAPPEEPVVSAETLAQLRAMMPESGVRQIYAAVVADLARRLTGLEAALAQGDLAQVRRIGHAIKGGCGMAGAVQAARLGARIEALAALPAPAQGSDKLDNSTRLLDDLRRATRDLERILKAEFPA